MRDKHDVRKKEQTMEEREKAKTGFSVKKEGARVLVKGKWTRTREELFCFSRNAGPLVTQMPC